MGSTARCFKPVHYLRASPTFWWEFPIENSSTVTLQTSSFDLSGFTASVPLCRSWVLQQRCPTKPRGSPLFSRPLPVVITPPQVLQSPWIPAHLSRCRQQLEQGTPGLCNTILLRARHWKKYADLTKHPNSSEHLQVSCSLPIIPWSESSRGACSLSSCTGLSHQLSPPSASFLFAKGLLSSVR